MNYDDMSLDALLEAIDKTGWRVFTLGNIASGDWIIDAVEKRSEPDKLYSYSSARGKTARGAAIAWLQSGGRKRGSGFLNHFENTTVVQDLMEALAANLEARKGYAIVEKDWLDLQDLMLTDPDLFGIP